MQCANAYLELASALGMLAGYVVQKSPRGFCLIKMTSLLHLPNFFSLLFSISVTQPTSFIGLNGNQENPSSPDLEKQQEIICSEGNETLF